ncbi:HNH endonuclease [Gordonia sp. HY285]|uniref:HNH endonuclease n=1 Tax=Gordonia liuliyuniae TaxID=2911517 RepID=A0ABS9IX89_9ACTN|nr:HNH endonuclease signature motif containing protein [Gordonia liuliyuniae]MCF8590194.1 HNH endonuclease [Gordonia liuliyuniae]MCF8610110.1 HNH endonuclease [Gordonia liuliyuniae]
MVALVPPRPRAARYARRRKTRMAARTHDLTDEQWMSLQDAWGGCAYCAAPGPGLQKDCMQPISRGGRYTLENVVPACRSCNASKCNTELTTWMRRKKHNERLFLERHVLIVRELTGARRSPESP